MICIAVIVVGWDDGKAMDGLNIVFTLYNSTTVYIVRIESSNVAVADTSGNQT
jgi:hypothetical protein